jgi:hypothetical protein
LPKPWISPSQNTTHFPNGWKRRRASSISCTATMRINCCRFPRFARRRSAAHKKNISFRYTSSKFPLLAVSRRWCERCCYKIWRRGTMLLVR